MDVFIIRLNDNNELIGFVEGIYENKVKTIHPHYIKYFADSQTLGMLPYCPLSDESRFDIEMSRIEFMVLPRKSIKRKYIEMLREDTEESYQETKDNTMILEGNQTLH